MAQCNQQATTNDTATMMVVMIAHSDAGQHRETVEVRVGDNLEAAAESWVSGITGHPQWDEVTVETQAGELLASIEI